jgi:hypothetical protein
MTNITFPLSYCTKEEQCFVFRLLWLNGVKIAEIHKCTQNVHMTSDVYKLQKVTDVVGMMIQKPRGLLLQPCQWN